MISKRSIEDKPAVQVDREDVEKEAAMSSRLFVWGFGALLLAAPLSAAGARDLFCGRNGLAYIVTTNNQGIHTFTPAGGCAGGPWTITLSLVLPREPESDWRGESFLGSVYTILRRFPTRAGRLTESPAELTGRYTQLSSRGVFKIRASRLPRHVAKLLAAPEGRKK
jgi:hypothetical protein